MTTEHAPHLSGVPKPARAHQGRPAGIVTRIIANALDLAAVLLLLVLMFLLVNGVSLAIRPLTYEPVLVPLPVTLAAGAVISVLYLTAAWASTGRTIGAAALGLRVLDAGSSQPLGPARAVIRAAACTVFPVGLLWLFLSAERRSLHDRLVGSVVVYHWSAH